MELQQIFGSGPRIQSYQSGELKIDNQLYTRSILVQPDHKVQHWQPQAFMAIRADDISEIIRRQPSVVLLGTGAVLEFPPTEFFAAFAAAKIGVEVMDTAAACRTYNLLMAEGRDVLAALLLR